MKIFIHTNFRIIAIVLFTIMICPSLLAEVVDVEEFIKQSSALFSAREEFSTSAYDDVGTVAYSEKLISFTKDNIIEIPRANGSSYKKNEPVEIEFFNSDGSLLSLNYIDKMGQISGFLPNNNLYYSYISSGPESWSTALYNLDGTLLYSFPNKLLLVSPGAEYLHTYPTMMDYQSLKVYNKEGVLKLKITTNGNYLVQAISDSLLLVVDRDGLKLCNVDTQGIVWESTIPDISFAIDKAYRISLSVSSERIVIRDMLSLHVFNFDGNHLWSLRNDLNDVINTIGLSDHNGQLFYTHTASGNLYFTILNIENEIIDHSFFDLGPNAHFATSWGFISDFYEKVILTRYTARIENKKNRVTSLLIYDGTKWHPFTILGLWYYLQEADGSGILIGSDSKRGEIVAYSMEF